jgi:hypothetical protein
MNDSAAIDVRQIEANAVRATLAIRVAMGADPTSANRVYRGEVYGPLASDRTTLPASYRVPDVRPGEEVQAIVIDPCFWSPEAPFEYEILLTPIDEDIEPAESLRRTIRLRKRSELT